MGTLAGCIALVSGSGRGIGRAIALRYAREGATVVVSDLDRAAAEALAGELRASGATADAFRADVSDPDQSSAMVDFTVERFGRIDVLVNNAGVIRVQPLLEVTPADWDFVNNVNARGLFFAVQAGARRMLGQPPLAPGRPKGKIVNVASIAGRSARPSPLFSAYAASKAAAISITQSTASALAPGVTVNAICPGVVDTEMWRRTTVVRPELRGPTASATSRWGGRRIRRISPVSRRSSPRPTRTTSRGSRSTWMVAY